MVDYLTVPEANMMMIQNDIQIISESESQFVVHLLMTYLRT